MKETNINHKKNTLQLNQGIFLYGFLCTMVLCTSYIQYFFKTSYTMANVLAIVFLMIGILFLIYLKIITIIPYKLSLMDIIILIFSIFLVILRMAFGDSVAWDTVNYHIYAQQSLGDNFITNSFFPGRAINSMCWILGDQIHYFFRHYLGYRLGTIGTFFVFILLYFQVKSIVNKLLNSLHINCNEVYIAFVSILCIMADNILWSLNLYYIDVFALPFLLAILETVVFAEKQNCLEIVWTAYMAGLVFSMKLSNAFILLVLGIIYLVKFIKYINVKSLLGAVVVLLFPIGVYVAWSIQLTGNPIFPYANGLFKSDYFTIEKSVNDIAAFPLRFGPETFWQYIFWPVYCMMNKTRIVDHGAYSGRLLCIFLGLIFYFISKIWITYNKKIKLCVGIFIVFYIEYLTVYEGYIRYMAILEILGSILIGVVIIAVILKATQQVSKILSILVSMSFLLQISVGLNDYCFSSNEIALRPSVFTDTDGYLKNLKYVFKDRESGVGKDIVDNVDVWLVTNYNSAYGCAIDASKPTVNLLKDSSVTNDKTEKIYNQQIENLKNKNVYAVANVFTVDAQIENMNNNNIIVEDVQNITPYFYNAEYGMLLLKTQVSTDKKTVSVYGGDGEAVYTIPYNNKKNVINVGIDAGVRSKQGENCIVEVWAKNLNNQEDYLLDTFELDYYDKYRKVSYDIPDEEWNDSTSIVITCYEKDDNVPRAVRGFVTEKKE